MYLGYHWLSDVVGAWLLATVVISVGMAFVSANRGLYPETVAGDPVVTRGGFARSLIMGGTARNLT